MARTWHRWLPAGAVVALIAGAATLTSQAGAADLPEKSPEDVLAMLAEQEVEHFSGTFTTSTELGLPLPADIDLGPGAPDLDEAGLGEGTLSEAGGAHGGAAGGPGDAGRGPDSPPGTDEILAALELLTGDSTGRVFVDGSGAARFQHLDGTEERNVVMTEQDVWLYDSATNEATRLLLPDPANLPERPGHPGHPGHLGLSDRPGLPEGSGPPPTPDELAATAVAALEPSTELRVGQHERIAGRDAYSLELAPRAAESLVEAVTIAVDGETGFPLSVTVTARGQAEPALHAGYTEIDFSAPDAGLFEFTPPAGAAVEEQLLDAPQVSAWTEAHDQSPDATARDARGPLGAEVLGSGWGAVGVVPLGEVPADPLLDQLTEPVEGGRMLSTALLSVLLTDDGRILAGAVAPEHLLDLAGR